MPTIVIQKRVVYFDREGTSFNTPEEAEESSRAIEAANSIEFMMRNAHVWPSNVEESQEMRKFLTENWQAIDFALKNVKELNVALSSE